MYPEPKGVPEGTRTPYFAFAAVETECSTFLQGLLNRKTFLFLKFYEKFFHKVTLTPAFY